MLANNWRCPFLLEDRAKDTTRRQLVKFLSEKIWKKIGICLCENWSFPNSENVWNATKREVKRIKYENVEGKSRCVNELIKLAMSNKHRNKPISCHIFQGSIFSRKESDLVCVQENKLIETYLLEIGEYVRVATFKYERT